MRSTVGLKSTDHVGAMAVTANGAEPICVAAPGRGIDAIDAAGSTDQSDADHFARRRSNVDADDRFAGLRGR